MKIIKFANYDIQPWKNGLGLTRLIAEDQKKMWRLSAASVKTISEFSEYCNCDRLLTVWQGDGLLLNNFTLKKNQIYKFFGETKILCKPLSAEVIDIGLIYHRDKFSTSMETFEVTNNKTLCFKTGQNFIFCLEGQFKVLDYSADFGDTLQFESSIEIAIEILAKQCTVLIISIESIC